MEKSPDQWFVFVVMTCVMIVATIWHVKQLKAGQIKGFKWTGELIFGRQIVTDRRRNPIRFTLLSWFTSILFLGCWIGWFLLFRAAFISD